MPSLLITGRCGAVDISASSMQVTGTGAKSRISFNSTPRQMTQSSLGKLEPVSHEKGNYSGSVFEILLDFDSRGLFPTHLFPGPLLADPEVDLNTTLYHDRGSELLPLA